MEIGESVKVSDRGGIDVFATFLGEFEDREWYWNLDRSEVFWRVPDIRECIAAPPGYQVLSADYSQIEVKLMAMLSQDPILIASINSKCDIHCFNAAAVFGDGSTGVVPFTYDDIWAATQAKDAKTHPRHKELNALRKAIKTVTFGVPYGAGKQMVAFRTGMTEDEAQKFIDAFFGKFKVLKAWLESQGNFALTWGYTTTPDGRRRFYTIPPKTDPDYDAELSQIRRYAGNHPIQASNADMLKKAIRMIYERIRGGVITGARLYDARLMLVVHDEVVMMCADKDVEAVSNIIIQCMTAAYESIVTGIWNEVKVVADVVWDH